MRECAWHLSVHASVRVLGGERSWVFASTALVAVRTA